MIFHYQKHTVLNYFYGSQQQGRQNNENTINRDVKHRRDTNNSWDASNIRDPEMLETPVSYKMSTAVGMAATAETLVTAGTRGASTAARTTAAVGTPETADTTTTAGVQATPTAEITSTTSESTASNSRGNRNITMVASNSGGISSSRDTSNAALQATLPIRRPLQDRFLKNLK